jgi:FtsP/CotA-like multicopper oxidase with cupredoxin domain
MYSLALPLLVAIAPMMQDAVIAPPARVPLPRPAASAPLASVNQNLTSAGRLEGKSLIVSLDVVEAAYQPEGNDDPVVRILALAERGKAPQVPAPLLRAPVGTTVRLTLRNRTDSALTFSGFRRALPRLDDTLQLAAGATRELTFTLDAAGTQPYYGMLKGLTNYRERDWLDSQLSGAIVADAVGASSARDRVFVITEWFHNYPDRPFESALVFNGKAWPHNERITLPQGDSVHWRFVNLAAIEHPLHLHGFYYRVERLGGERGDSAVAPERQFLQNMETLPMGGTMSISWLPTTPGNWVFHCHFASHVGETVTLHGSPDPYVVHLAGAPMDASHSMHGGHQMRGLVIGLHVTPSPGYHEPVVAERRTLHLFAQKKAARLVGRQTAYGFVLQRGDSAPARDSVTIPGPVLELRRGQPVRIVVKNTMDEPTGVHWHGLEIESYPDGVPNVSGMGAHVMPPIAPGDSFAAEFTPPRSGTFPYHAHLDELRQIGSGMYGAILVTDGPRDTTRDHVIVAGGGGVPVFAKAGPAFLLVNGRVNPRALHMTVGDTNRLRIVSIHSDELLGFRLGDDSTVARWMPIARDGADLPDALRRSAAATIVMGPGQTGDFLYVPQRPGEMRLEVWLATEGTIATRVALPIVVDPRGDEKRH